MQLIRRALKTALFIAAIILLIAAGFLILNIAWNFVMPKFGLPQLNFLETIALVIVAKALLGLQDKQGA